MPTGSDVERSAARFYGEPYSTAGGRTSQTSGYKDCSGLVYAALVGVGVNPGGNTVSTSLETWAVRSGGRYVDAAFAQANPGCGMAIWGTGAHGHIGLSAAPGRCLETPSQERHGVGYSRFLGKNGHWTGYFTFPGVTYSGVTEPNPESNPQPIDRSSSMLNVRRDANDAKGVWIYDGVRISPEAAYGLAAGGVRATTINLVQLDRGLRGDLDPNNGIQDADWMADRIKALQGGNASAAWAEAHQAATLATQADDRIKKVMDFLGVSE